MIEFIGWNVLAVFLHHIVAKSKLQATTALRERALCQHAH